MNNVWEIKSDFCDYFYYSYLITEVPYMLPNLIVIGAMKSGTSSLHAYLNLHPQISMSRPKELKFFTENNWSKGVKWYESYFTDEAKIVGESSPQYTMCHFFGGVPERMYSLLPDVKLIYILRDPINRIISQYVHQVHKGREERCISDALMNLENHGYVLCSKYYMQLEKYLEHFPASNILILTFENLISHRRQTLQKVFRFLDIDETFYSEGFSNALNKSSVKRRTTKIGSLLSKMPGKKTIKSILPFSSRFTSMLFKRQIEKPMLNEKLRQELIDILKDDIDLLRKYTGSDFADWCL